MRVQLQINFWYIAFIMHFMMYIEPRFALFVFACLPLIFITRMHARIFCFPSVVHSIVLIGLIVDILFVLSGAIHWRFPNRSDANLFIVLKALLYVPYLSLIARSCGTASFGSLLSILAFVFFGNSTTAQVSIIVFCVLAVALVLGATKFVKLIFFSISIIAFSFPLWFPYFESLFYLSEAKSFSPGKIFARILIWRDAYDHLVPFAWSMDVARTVNILGVDERFLHPHNLAFDLAFRIGFVPYSILVFALLIGAFIYARWDIDAFSLPSLAAGVTLLSFDYSIEHVWPVLFFVYAIVVCKFTRLSQPAGTDLHSQGSRTQSD